MCVRKKINSDSPNFWMKFFAKFLLLSSNFVNLLNHIYVYFTIRTEVARILLHVTFVAIQRYPGRREKNYKDIVQSFVQHWKLMRL